MSWDSVVIAVSTVLAAVIAAFLAYYLNHKRVGTKWKLLKCKDIPVWVVHSVYREGFPNKYQSITAKRFFLAGTHFEYLVEITDRTIREPWAKVRHLRVRRRRR